MGGGGRVEGRRGVGERRCDTGVGLADGAERPVSTAHAVGRGRVAGGSACFGPRCGGRALEQPGPGVLARDRARERLARESCSGRVRAVRGDRSRAESDARAEPASGGRVEGGAAGVGKSQLLKSAARLAERGVMTRPVTRLRGSLGGGGEGGGGGVSAARQNARESDALLASLVRDTHTHTHTSASEGAGASSRRGDSSEQGEATRAHVSVWRPWAGAGRGCPPPARAPAGTTGRGQRDGDVATVSGLVPVSDSDLATVGSCF